MIERKKQYVYLLGIPALAVILFSILSGISTSDPDQAVQSLIKERTSVLTAAACGNLRPEAAEKLLKQIEQDEVLFRDRKRLRRYSEAGAFCFTRVKHLRRKKTMFRYITYEAEIQWDRGDSVRSGLYNIALQKEADRYRLAVFEPAG